MRYALVLWDFHGTLADTLPGVLRIFNDLASELGFTPITDVQGIRDTTPTQFFKAHGIPLWRLLALRHAIVARQKNDMESIRLYAGVPEVLEQIGRSGWARGHKGVGLLQGRVPVAQVGDVRVVSELR